MTGYPWSTGDELLAADLNAAIASSAGSNTVLKTGDTMTGPLQVPVGTTIAPGLGLGAADGTGISRSANAVVISAQGTLIGAFIAGSPAAAQFYTPIFMLNNRIQQLGDATAAADALNMRTGDARYALAGSGSTGTVTNIATSGSGISGGPITTTGTLSVQWNAGAVNSMSGLSLAAGVLTAAPAAASITGTMAYSQLPAEVQQLPISFPFAGLPAASARVNVPMAFAVTIPANLAGTVIYCTTKTTANATFNINKILSTGGTTTIGTVVITPTSNTSCTLSGTGGSLAAGDVLQIFAPVSQDATLSDVGISILAART
jgi:hypothetical protein